MRLSPPSSVSVAKAKWRRNTTMTNRQRKLQRAERARQDRFAKEIQRRNLRKAHRYVSLRAKTV